MGWDPTMLLYPSIDLDESSASELPTPRPSYEIPPPEGKDSESKTGRLNIARSQRWLVTVEHEDGQEEAFVLFHLLSEAHAEVIRGRATRVWKAWTQAEYDEINEPEKRSVSCLQSCSLNVVNIDLI